MILKPGRQYVVMSQKPPFSLGDKITDSEGNHSIVVEIGDDVHAIGVEPATWYRRLYWWIRTKF